MSHCSRMPPLSPAQSSEAQHTDRPLWRFHWRRVPGAGAREDAELLTACAELYSTSYGVWGEAARRKGYTPGERIRRRPGDIAKLPESQDAFLALAELPSGELVGYCIAVFTPAPQGLGRIAWVSQLVVGEAFRHAGRGDQPALQRLGLLRPLRLRIGDQQPVCGPGRRDSEGGARLPALAHVA